MTHILIGRIAGAHGIRGAVKLRSFATVAADIAQYGPLATADGREIEILRLKPGKDEFIADLKNVRDRNQAEALAGTDLFVSRERLPTSGEGEYYLADLVGKSVGTVGKALGVVAGIQNFGAGDLLELDNGLLIPVIFINEAASEITVTLPDGYLDPAESPRGQNGRP